VHLGFLDGLRGWSAVFVVLHHIWQFAAMGPDYQPLPAWFTVTSFLKFGSWAVAVFIVLSGYCLMLPVVRTPGAFLPRGLGDFLTRRARRILPGYYAAVVFSILFLLLIPPLRRSTGTLWDITSLPVLTPGDLVSHTFLVHNLSEHWQWKLNAPMWSVALEWQIYFLFALVFLPVWRRIGPKSVVALAFALGLAPLTVGFGFASTWFIGLFALGMFAAHINFASPAHLPRLPPGLWRGVTIAGALGVMAVMVLSRRGHMHPAVGDILVGITTSGFLISSTDRLQQLRPMSWGLRALSHPVSTKLGDFSYSLYLTHYPIVAACYLGLRRLGLGPAATFHLQVVVGLPLLLLVAYGFHLLFEKPFLSRDRVAPMRKVA